MIEERQLRSRRLDAAVAYRDPGIVQAVGHLVLGNCQNSDRDQ
jgi:hypothetical protein